MDRERMDSWVSSVDELLDWSDEDRSVGPDAMRVGGPTPPLPCRRASPGVGGRPLTEAERDAVLEAGRRAFATFSAQMASVRRVFAATAARVTEALAPLNELARALGTEKPPADPRARALWLRQRRDTGPALPPLARR